MLAHGTFRSFRISLSLRKVPCICGLGNHCLDFLILPHFIFSLLKIGLKRIEVIRKLSSDSPFGRFVVKLLDHATSRVILVSDWGQLILLKTYLFAHGKAVFNVNSIFAWFQESDATVQDVWVKNLGDYTVHKPLCLHYVNWLVENFTGVTDIGSNLFITTWANVVEEFIITHIENDLNFHSGCHEQHWHDEVLRQSLTFGFTILLFDAAHPGCDILVSGRLIPFVMGMVWGLQVTHIVICQQWIF